MDAEEARSCCLTPPSALQIERCDTQIKELEAIDASPVRSHGGLRLVDWMYRRTLCRLSSPAAALRRQQARREVLIREKEALEQQALEPTGHALLVFDTTQAASDMLNDHEHRLAKTWLARLLGMDLSRAFHRATGAGGTPPLIVASS
jgi:hypothetical protein